MRHRVLDPGPTTPADRYPADTCALRGSASTRLAATDDSPLWLVEADLEPACELRWDSGHGDEALYVQEGALEYEGRTCPRGGAMIVERGVAARVRALQATRLVHFGARTEPDAGAGGADRGAHVIGPGGADRGVHVIGPGGMFAEVDDKRETRFFADSTCPTCSITLLYTARSFDFRSAPHSHSQDELVYVLEGEIQLGRNRLVPGATAFIPADQPYGFHAPDGFAFLNYRRGASVMTVARDGRVIVEGGLSTGMAKVADVR